jgi:histidinol phosphatase-like PHP family hydrolase
LERRAYLWAKRLDALLDMDIPFEKTGIAHITDGLTAPRQWDDHLKVFSMIEQNTLDKLFEKAAERKVGIELNLNFDSYSVEEREIIGRVYFTAKRKGCKFYFGSDAHHPAKFQTAPSNFRKIADWLELEESDKFISKTD